MGEKQACITLDLEDDSRDFDLDHPALENLDAYISMINDVSVPVSVFAVGQTIQTHPEAVEKIRRNIDSDFYLHSYSHSIDSDFEEEILKGKDAFREFFGNNPVGYRAPLGAITPEEFTILEEEGFDFDSSIFPSYRPGVFSNLDCPIYPYRPSNVKRLIELPFAVLPYLRIPISQSYIKLLGRPFIELLKWAPLPDIIVFDSHIQDFFRTETLQHLSPFLRFVHSRNIFRSKEIFKEVIGILRSRGYDFVNIREIYEEVEPNI